ncbi:MAG: Grx4 family monothiol glutaredoxin [Candidatus Marinimicrobia bacterium]|nr:Grx4 family monothiol glutaredoxin [Candidatus Neomarinimicrobiota bacterium]
MKQRVEKTTQSDRIFLMIKGTPEMPMCGFSARVVRVLSQYDVPYSCLNIFEDMELTNAIKEYSNWPTTPQLYVDGELIGGCDIVEELDANGELKTILKS